MNWWATAPTVVLPVMCSGAHHGLRWEQGEIVLPDHPELDGELALIGFGGEEPHCLFLRRLWLDAVADGGFLGEWVDEHHLGSARLSWLTMALERMASEGFHEFLRELPAARAERMGQFLHRFPRPWLDRAAAAVSAAVVGGDGVICNQAPQLLDAAAAVRLRRAFVSAVGGNQTAVGAAALVPLSLAVAATDKATVDGRLSGSDRKVAITIARSWLHQVWGAGAAVIDGHLVLARRSGDEMAIVDWSTSDLGKLGNSHRPLLRWAAARFDDGHWSLSENEAEPMDRSAAC